MRSLVLILSLALLIFGSVSVADATPVDFKIGDNNSIVEATGGLDIVTDFSGLADTAFSLSEVGDWVTFDYATIKSITVNNTDQSEFSIIAYLSFILPEKIVAGSEGTIKTIEVAGMCNIVDSMFSVNFDSKDMSFDTDGSFKVQLSSIIDASLWLAADGCGSGCYYINENEGLITATVTLTKSPTAVPEPSTFILFGTILIGALGVKKIKG